MSSRNGRSRALDRHLVLMGFMAAGKSVVGRGFAARQGMPFLDTDEAVVARYGPIAGIFSAYGEHYFREVEARTVAAALEARVPTVISLGGGAVLDSGTQQLLSGATVVFLDTDLATVLPRITRAGHRPLLAPDPVRRWQELADIRRPIYESLADITIDTRGLTVPAIIDRLTSVLIKGED
ncbi:MULTISPECIES: shikimate kinase [Arthrobacter]|uniref:Shikimate kinase n=1 Tax=Arthrobacter jinronghuae TaxID=2964609 RepID=A0ABT1NTD9_9MICC|nr:MULTISPECIES: shikimate kinase [Arthrobacter]MCQ1950337.1 shikimate kinase [Arthrobacter jinronghuae]MCQ1953263.1 shikimate kinase [Arthrobacter sp. zg-Y238]UWX77314.1 shikimate kinase [Arthrobacter jinronghuae]